MEQDGATPHTDHIQEHFCLKTRFNFATFLLTPLICGASKMCNRDSSTTWRRKKLKHFDELRKDVWEFGELLTTKMRNDY